MDNFLKINDPGASGTILADIRALAFSYLETGNISDNVPDADIIDSYEFLAGKFSELKHIKDNYSTHVQYNPFDIVNYNLDAYEELGTFTANPSENIYNRLSKDVEAAMIEIGFCYGIFRKIIQERKIFKH